MSLWVTLLVCADALLPGAWRRGWLAVPRRCS